MCLADNSAAAASWTDVAVGALGSQPSLRVDLLYLPSYGLPAARIF